MKKLFALILIGIGLSGFAHADFVAYEPQAFTAAQKNNDKILLHFSADWCPTCRAQRDSLSQLEKAGKLKGLILMLADYDKESDLKKQMKVTHQSTLIAFYGGFETARATGETSVEDLGQFAQKNLVLLTLKDQLRLISESSAAKVPPEKRKKMDEAIAQLKASQLTEKSIKIGQKFPNFKLKNAEGRQIELKQLLKKSAVVISFYRGSWCPYCNAQLSDYQKHLGEFIAHGGTLVAVTPEKPELEVTMKAGKKIEFDILNDNDNKLAGQLGLVFGLTPELKAIYQEFGIDLQKSQGNPDWKLPVPATFVVAQNGKVAFAFVDVDYTKRAEACDILTALDSIQK